jgi:alpha-D-ribose 1-methylphosphonate 5-triphosphate synthase subunit PhnI
MGYAAARGGLDAIVAAEELVRRTRVAGRSSWLEPDQLVERLRYAVDRVMGEGGLWAPELAARALRQAEGDVIEAAHLLRTHRATLPRFGYTDPVDTDEIELLRRIVPAYREAPGPQLLGRTLDYTGRLLDLTPDDQARQASAEASAAAAAAPPIEDPQLPPAAPVRLLDLLRSQDLAVDRRRTDDPEPTDITRVAARPGADRSALLATMARAETGALVNLWYRNILGPDSYLHEITLGEVRHGRLPVRVAHGVTGEPVRIGGVRITEVEAIEDLDGVDEQRTHFDVGYGCCLGHNERKAIAMANLDISLHRDRGRSGLAQAVLMTTDGLDASGFLEHLKLPHYVTFRSMTERKRTMRTERAQAGRRQRVTSAGPDTRSGSHIDQGEATA